MKCETYQIGDIADMAGISRDTLRYYEKRGLISPQKGENGYRYYTNDDVQRLLTILYQRKMNFGLDDIESIWTDGHMPYELGDLIEERILQEEQAIRAHQQTIARLNLSREDGRHFQKGVGAVQMEEFPEFYVIIPQTTMQDSIALWFQYARRYSGLDMMYVYDEYQWQRQDGCINTEYKNSQLVLYKHLKDYVDYAVPEETQPAPASRFCVSTFCCSSSRIPDPEIVRAMVDWASGQELIVSTQLFVTFIAQGAQKGENVWYLQLMLPVF